LKKKFLILEKIFQIRFQKKLKLKKDPAKIIFLEKF